MGEFGALQGVDHGGVEVERRDDVVKALAFGQVTGPGEDGGYFGGVFVEGLFPPQAVFAGLFAVV